MTETAHDVNYRLHRHAHLWGVQPGNHFSTWKQLLREASSPGLATGSDPLPKYESKNMDTAPKELLCTFSFYLMPIL